MLLSGTPVVWLIRAGPHSIWWRAATTDYSVGRGRDANGRSTLQHEEHLLQIWTAPASATSVLKMTNVIGQQHLDLANQAEGTVATRYAFTNDQVTLVVPGYPPTGTTLLFEAFTTYPQRVSSAPGQTTP